MSFLDKLNQLLKQSPFRSLLIANPAHVSFTEPQSGNEISAALEYIRLETVVYLLLPANDNRWKNLAKGLPVNIQADGIDYKGWAEDLTGYAEFLQILAKNPAKQAEIKQQYGLNEVPGILSINQLEEFLKDYKLIRVKISR